MSHLANLPNELLNDIVYRVRDNSTPDSLLALSTTCKALHRLVRSIQRQHAILLWRLNKTAPIARYMDAHDGDTDIRILRLRPQKGLLNAFRVRMPISLHHVQPLCEFLASLPNLATFSLSLDLQVDLQCHLPGHVLARIVRHLPPSVINLEIDTEAIDRIAEDEETVRQDAEHLCVAISTCIPRLHTLWLRLSCICSELFRSLQASADAQPTSALRRAFIRLDNSPSKEHRLGISKLVGDCAVPKSDRGHVSQGILQHYKAIDLFKFLLNIQAAGAFPHLERFFLFSWEHCRFDSTYFKHFINVRDVASRTLTRYPKYWAKEILDWNISDINEKERETFYMVRDHNGNDYYEDRAGFEPALLHDVIWTETLSGIRYPPQDPLSHSEPRLRASSVLSAHYLHKIQDIVEKQRAGREAEWNKMAEEIVLLEGVESPEEFKEYYTDARSKVKVQNPITNEVIIERY